ncbi:RNA polymerase sigma factor [Winogradskyella flava]|uniref:Sigma-70 family RNA polymerase sigma factor n=1 Tax=Winogradskyella flava TaxID=1884876 RepID=A0A842IQP2_9FLAO|nr:sigma-70 family RNA polymerase sigma factor [Winogradskyella flava]MBC2845330.1 sigma-70 family RNA polymerase sigma factor [Winogradskyella flava]
MKQEQLVDNDLIKRVLEGDSNAFKLIISKTQGLVIQIIYKMVNNREDREDLAQEVYFKVYNKLSSFRFNSKLSTWIGAITYNTCINHLKKKRIPILDIETEDEKDIWEIISMDNLNSESNLTEGYVLNKERSQILKLEVEKLPPLYKTIVTLFHVEELSYKEISKITNLPEGTLKNYLFRARKKLRDNLLLNYKKDDL